MNNRCGSAKLLAGAMTRMSNKLVYHFLRFNEPPAGVNRRGATLTRFLSSQHCIYGRGSRRVKTLEAAPDLIRQVTLFVDRFSRRVYELPLEVLGGWRIRVWEQRSGGKYTTCSAPVAPVVMSCRPPCNTTEMFWLRRRVQTAAGCLFTIFTPTNADCRVSFTRSSSP